MERHNRCRYSRAQYLSVRCRRSANCEVGKYLKNGYFFLNPFEEFTRKRMILRKYSKNGVEFCAYACKSERLIPYKLQ